MLEFPTTTIESGRALRVGEVAELLGVSASTIRWWEDRYGVGPTARSAGGHRRYDAAGLERLRSLRDLVNRGHALGRAASVAGDGTSHVELVLATTRALLRAPDVGAVREALAAYVHVVGGTVVPPDDAGRGVLPLDLSFGEGEPIVAEAEDPSVVRLRLEASLPALVADARRVVALLRSREAG